MSSKKAKSHKKKEESEEESQSEQSEQSEQTASETEEKSEEVSASETETAETETEEVEPEEVYQSDLDAEEEHDTVEYPAKYVHKAIRETVPKADRHKVQEIVDGYADGVRDPNYAKRSKHGRPVFVIMYGPSGKDKACMKGKVLGPLLGVHDYINVSVDDIVDDILGYNIKIATELAAETAKKAHKAAKKAARKAGTPYVKAAVVPYVPHNMTDLYTKYRVGLGEKVAKNLLYYGIDSRENVVLEVSGDTVDDVIIALRMALDRGYKTVVVWPYDSLQGLETNVHERAKRTFRTVTQEAIRSFYRRATDNFFTLLRFVHHIYVFDTSSHVKSIFGTLLFERHAAAGYNLTVCNKALQSVSLYDAKTNTWNHECKNHWTPSTHPKPHTAAAAPAAHVS